MYFKINIKMKNNDFKFKREEYKKNILQILKQKFTYL